MFLAQTQRKQLRLAFPYPFPLKGAIPNIFQEHRVCWHCFKAMIVSVILSLSYSRKSFGFIFIGTAKDVKVTYVGGKKQETDEKVHKKL